MLSLHSYRDRTAHYQRRRVWSAGFGDRALRGYEKRIQVYRQILFQRLEEMAKSKSVISISKWFNSYSYGTMGDLAFARSFDMLDAMQNHWAIAHAWDDWVQVSVSQLVFSTTCDHALAVKGLA